MERPVENPGTTIQPQMEVPNYEQIALEAGQAADAARAARHELYARSAYHPAVEAEQVESGLADARKDREDAIYRKALGRTEDEIYDKAYTDAYLKSIKGTMDEGHYLESAGETAARHDVREPAAAESARQHAEDELRMARRKAETEVEADSLWQSTYANKLQELGATEIADTDDPNDMFHNAALDAADEAVAAYRQKRRPLVDKLSNAAEQFGMGAATGRDDAAEDRTATEVEPNSNGNPENDQARTGNVYRSIFAGEHRSDFQRELAEQASEEDITAVEAIAADLLHTAEQAKDDDARRRETWGEYRNFMAQNNLKPARISKIVDDVQWALNPPPVVNYNANRGSAGNEDDDELSEDDNSARINRFEAGRQRLSDEWRELRGSFKADLRRIPGDLTEGWNSIRNSRFLRRLVGNRAVAAEQQPDQNA